MDLASICPLCEAQMGVNEHAVFLAIYVLDTGEGVSEQDVANYCNTELVGCTIDDIHLRLAFAASQSKDVN